MIIAKKGKLGIFMTCYDEVDAIKFALNSLRQFYPNSRIYITHESNADFSFAEQLNVKINQGKDSMGPVLGLKENDYRSDAQQKAIKTALLTLIERIMDSIPFLNSEYIILHCPDTLIRGTLSIPDGTGLLGSTVNKYFSGDTNNVLVKYGGIPISYFGAVPAIFNVDDFLKAHQIILENKNIIDELCQSWYAVFSHDILIPILFSLIGKSETFNPDIIECERNPDWQITKHPLVHQFRKYYPPRTSKYKINEQHD